MIKGAKINTVVIAVVLCIFGVLFLLGPELTASVICYCVAISMGVIAVSFLVKYMKSRKLENYIGNELGIAVAIFVFGIFIATMESKITTSVIPIVIGFALVYDSCVKLQDSIFLYKKGSKKWFYITILAVVNLAVAVILLWNPWFKVQSNLVMAQGVGLLFSGVTDLVTTIFILKQAKNTTVSEADSTEIVETSQQD